MIDVVATIQLWVLFDNRLISALKLPPYTQLAVRDVVPGALVSFAAMIGASVWNGLLDCAADVPQIVRQMACIQSRLHSHHPATNIDPHSCWNDRAFGWDDTADGRANSPMDIRHRGNPLIDDRQMGNVQELLSGFVLQLYAFCPSFDWNTLLDFNKIVFGIRHCFNFLK